ncbi:hypothetical protein K9O30_00100 [Clostridium bowmanii]|uniref:hypothetical protein n=1 Tax=Clostridium bowmanii TaxID=132925 RepID=UPI001C0D4151|nr:hypothetical protein [Clostridium bowmanii]MBU3187994.1 hypothetical protein [Clostridium bowmanii]MCA1072173.1 hypothetical protein [Clostridium bowmanii]
MTRFILLVSAVCIAVIGITYLIHRLVGRKKYAKYIPAVIFLLMGIYNVYMIRNNPGEGFGDLIKALYLFVCATCVISGVCTGVFIDFILPKLYSKK